MVYVHYIKLKFYVWSKKKREYFSNIVKLLVLECHYHAGNILPAKKDTSMMCFIDCESFFSFTKNAWIRDSAVPLIVPAMTARCKMFQVAKINELVQGSFGSMKDMKHGNMLVKLCEMHKSEINHA